MADLNQTPSANRVHIAFFGKRNAGKSSVVNAVTGQNLSLVSDVKGTTTDPVQKAMELLPLGPVVIIDTPGMDDEGELGEMRVHRARQVLARTDIAVLVVDAVRGLQPQDEALLKLFQERKVPYLIALNKCDLLSPSADVLPGALPISAATGQGLDELLEKIGGRLDTGACRVVLRLPYDQGGVVDMLHRQAKVERVDYGEAIEVEAVCTPVQLGRLKDYIVSGWTPPKEPWED